MNRSRLAHLGVSLLLVGLVLIVYWPAARFGYVSIDDALYVTENPWVQQGLTPSGIGWAFTTGRAANWHPLTWLSLMLDTTVLGNHAWAHHSVNISLHAMNVLLLWWVLASMTGAYWRSVMVACLTAVHPIHVESVAWVSERKDVLSMLVWLLALLAYVRYSRTPGVGRYLLVAGLFGLGLLAKPMVITLPVVLLLLDYWPLKRIEFSAMGEATWRRAGVLILEKLPMLALALASAAVTVFAQHRGDVLAEGRWLTIPERLEMVARGYVWYPIKLLWPTHLSALYPNLAQIDRMTYSLWEVSFAGALLFAMTLAAVALARRAPYVVVGWLWYVITLSPVVGFVQIGRHTAADRYAYIPFIGMYVILAWGAADLVRTLPWRAVRWAIVMVLIAGVCVLAITAHRQVYVWRDSASLVQRALDSTRDNWLMHVKMADIREQEGRFDDAVVHAQTASDICVQCAWVHRRCGEILAGAGRWFEAERALRRAVELDSANALGQANHGAALVQVGRSAEGLERLRYALQLDPNDGGIHKAMAIALASSGHRDAAVEHMREAMRLRPEMVAEWEPLLEALSRGIPVSGGGLR